MGAINERGTSAEKHSCMAGAIGITEVGTCICGFPIWDKTQLRFHYHHTYVTLFRDSCGRAWTHTSAGTCWCGWHGTLSEEN